MLRSVNRQKFTYNTEEGEGVVLVDALAASPLNMWAACLSET
jgi:hypothetical protein